MTLRSVVAMLAVLISVPALVEAQSQGAGGPSEGIKVHGHWTIDVRNPDGTLSSHTEFDNALIPGTGGDLLANLLNRQRTAGSWIVFLTDQHDRGACTLVQPSGARFPASCYVTEPAAVDSSGVDRDRNATLVASLVTSASGGLTGVKLTGTALVTNPNNPIIDQVTSGQGTCANTVTPADCPTTADGSRYRLFTTHLLATPIVPVVGQTVHVTVTFTFS
jgi:hypothetical protein